jgi:hypothetical protein
MVSMPTLTCPRPPHGPSVGLMKLTEACVGVLVPRSLRISEGEQR